MKRTMTFLALLLVMCLAAGSLSACGSKSPADDAAETEEESRRRGRLDEDEETETEETEEESGSEEAGDDGALGGKTGGKGGDKTSEAQESKESRPADTSAEPSSESKSGGKTGGKGGKETTAAPSGTETEAPSETESASETETSESTTPAAPAFTGDWEDYVQTVLIPQYGLVDDAQSGSMTDGLLFTPGGWYDGAGIYAWEDADFDGDGKEELFFVYGVPTMDFAASSGATAAYEVHGCLLRSENGRITESDIVLRDAAYDNTGSVNLIVHLVNAGGVPQILQFTENLDYATGHVQRWGNLYLIDATQDAGLQYAYGTVVCLDETTNDVPLYEISFEDNKGTATQVETKLRAGSLDIRGGVPLTVYYDMMGPYLTTRYIKVWDDFEPAEGGEDILEHCIKTDGTGAWCELER